MRMKRQGGGNHVRLCTSHYEYTVIDFGISSGTGNHHRNFAIKLEHPERHHRASHR